MSLHPRVNELAVISFKCRPHEFRPMHKCSYTCRPRSCTRACDLSQMGRTAALYNIDYYVVSPLTLMGCYSDLKWFNGSQVGPLMALFILQCLLWMWMTVLWSASVFFPHLLKQCDRCRFTGRVEGSREKRGKAHVDCSVPRLIGFFPYCPSFLSSWHKNDFGVMITGGLLSDEKDRTVRNCPVQLWFVPVKFSIYSPG